MDWVQMLIPQCSVSTTYLVTVDRVLTLLNNEETIFAYIENILNEQQYFTETNFEKSSFPFPFVRFFTQPVYYFHDIENM